MATTHACPGKCGRQVPRYQFACRSDWARLPAEIRQAITSTYKRDRLAHYEAMGDALDWYRENPREAARG
jgi:hypothetical protein